MIGTIVGDKYRVVRPLGVGGMGAVWVAVQEPLGREVALKVIRSGGLDAGGRARFEREARIVAGLRCPHVVTLFDFGEHEGAPYIVLELLDGVTLRARLERGPLAIDEALALARDVACGLRSAHESGVVHRDLKPENVVLVPDKDRGTRAKLLDFGIAKPLRDAAEGAGEAPQTRLGAIVGTAGYIAPELALHGVSDDPRLDLYALGVILFEMIAGAPPFEAPTALGLLTAHASMPAPDVRSRRPEARPELAALIARLLAKQPDARPRDGDALVAELDALRASGPPSPSLRPLEHAVTGLALTLPDRPSIAVQPFVATGGSEDDALFAQSVGEDVLVALARFKQLFVVSQFTMIAPAGRDSDALRVGATLGVRYVVQGTVRRTGERLRVIAKLVDTRSGAPLWANRYDRDAVDLFELQDEITREIVARVAGHVEAAHGEHARKMPPHTLLAYDWLARGRAYHHRATAEDNERSRDALERAVALDPDFTQAQAWRACAYGQAFAMGLRPPEHAARAALEGLMRALALDDTDAECHRLACEISFAQRDLVRAEHHHRRAIELNPNDARIVGQAGELELYVGTLDRAAARLMEAMRLDPLGPKPYLRLLARVRYLERDLDEAWRLFRCTDDGHPRHAPLGAAIAALRGDAAEASALADRARAAGAPTAPPPFADPARVERWREGVTAAGLG